MNKRRITEIPAVPNFKFGTNFRISVCYFFQVIIIRWCWVPSQKSQAKRQELHLEQICCVQLLMQRGIQPLVILFLSRGLVNFRKSGVKVIGSIPNLQTTCECKIQNPKWEEKKQKQSFSTTKKNAARHLQKKITYKSIYFKKKPSQVITVIK